MNTSNAGQTMKNVNGTLYLEVQDLLKVGIPEGSIKSGIDRYRKQKTTQWECINDEFDKRKVLISYNSLNSIYKELISGKLLSGISPENFIKQSIIDSMLVLKSEDKSIIDTYKTPKGEYLPDETKKQYLKALPYLRLCASVTLKDVKNLGFKSRQEFYKEVICEIKRNKIKLNCSEKKLRQRVAKYKEIGAKAIISNHFERGANNIKVTNDRLSLIIELAALPNHYSAPQVAETYNKIAIEKGFSLISDKTAQVYIKKHWPEIIAHRDGFSKWNNYINPIVSRNRPSSPNKLWVGDGVVYELYYQTANSYWERLVVYMVVDAFNDYILGFAIDKTESNDLAKRAWRNACLNTGVLPYQIKTDNYGAGSMRGFYESIVFKPHYYTPSAVGNPRDKIIEPLFARIYNEVTRQHNNAAGRNIESNEKVNRDFLKKIHKDFPNEQGVISQIESDIQQWNTKPRKKLNGVSIKEQWLTANHDTDRILTDYDKLNLFGKKHIYSGGETIKLSNKGIVFTIDGVTRNYIDWDSTEIHKHIGKSFYVIYDNQDLSKILITDEDSRNKFLLPLDTKNSMYIGDREHGEGAELHKKYAVKKRLFKELVNDAAQERQENIAKIGANEQLDKIRAEGAFKLMPIIKGDQKQLNNFSQNTLKKLTPSEDSNQSTKVNEIKPISSVRDSIFINDVPKTLRIINTEK